jgi:hypothetical protein
VVTNVIDLVEDELGVGEAWDTERVGGVAAVVLVPCKSVHPVIALVDLDRFGDHCVANADRSALE